MRHQEPLFRREKVQCDSASRAALGNYLQQSYGAILSEPLPESLSALVQRLEHAQETKPRSSPETKPAENLD